MLRIPSRPHPPLRAQPRDRSGPGSGWSTYALAGQQIAIQDPRGNFITMAYDNAGRQKSIQNELGFLTTTSYDAAGRPVTIIDPNLQVKTLTYDNTGRVGIVYHGDREARQSGVIAERFVGVANALEVEGIIACSAVYNDDFKDEFVAQCEQLDGLLVWVNPIESGRNRSKLDAALRELADQGVMVSAHPDTIMKMGTKQVLFDTKRMDWGTDVRVYRSLSELQSQLPQQLLSGPKVLKQYRGHSGGGIWKVRLENDKYYARHAQRGCFEQQIPFDDLMASFAPYFEGDGRMVEQPYQSRLPEGMIRCYQVIDRIEGFGHQAINALYPEPVGAKPEDAPHPGPRLYYPPDQPEFQAIKAKMENDWIPELRKVLDLTLNDLPLLWDADFLLGPKDESGADTYVLCEINVSSVSPFPEWAQRSLARATRQRIERRTT